MSAHFWHRCAHFWAACILLAGSGAVMAEQSTDGETAIEEGRRALDPWQSYPWYDAENDSVRRIKVKPAPPPKPPAAPRNWNFSGYEVLQWIGWAAIAIVLGLLAYALIRRFLESESAQAATAPQAAANIAEADRVEALPISVAAPVSEWLHEAERHYRNGDFERAIVYLYSYQLVELDKAHVIRLTRGKTNRQYLRETRRASTLGDLLQATMIAFEDVYFGHHPLSSARFEACWQRLPEFQQELAGAAV